MTKLRFGVLSSAKIGINKVIPAMQKGKHCTVTAMASRDLAKAKAVIGPLGIANAYGSYEELLTDPEIDAIYNPLPNHLHVSWSIKCLEAGKHVLCEKPIGMNVREAEELLAAAKRYPRLKIMEAFMYRHHPQWQMTRKLISEGQLGELRTVQSFFSYNNANPSNIRNIAEVGGGGLRDIGCYCISSARFIFNAEPRQVIGIVEYDPTFKTDRLASAMLEFDKGMATFICATQLSACQRVNISGTDGRIEMEIPFTPPPDRPVKLWQQRGSDSLEHILDTCDQYTIQGDLFSLAVLEDKPVPTPLEDAVVNMRVIEAVIESAKSGTWRDV